MQSCRVASTSRAHAAAALVVIAFAMTYSLAAADREHSVPIGDLEFKNRSMSFVERFAVPEELAQALTTAQLGEAVEIASFPVEPGLRAPVRLTRVDVYARGARVFEVNSEGTHELPRSKRLYFRGTSEWGPELRVGLSTNPETGTIRGIVLNHGLSFAIAEPDGAEERIHRFGNASALTPDEAPNLEYHCGAEDLPEDLSVDPSAPAPAYTPWIELKAAQGPLYQSTIAFDTDMEWLYYRFADNTTDATAWIADYINQSNAMYERDLSLRLLVGDTYLRTGGSPFTSDPYSASASPADSAMLDEFGNHWAANYGGVDRVFAQLLSGKSSLGTSSSGIAWIDGYCETQSNGGGYSVFEPFKESWVPMSSNVSVGAHELGHNFASPHTHCYSPPIDECYNGEAYKGCFAGTPTCPTGGSGTMMSYCHVSTVNGGADCGDNLIEFHPTVIARLDTYRAAHTPGCVELFAADELIFQDGFERGDTSQWDSAVP